MSSSGDSSGLPGKKGSLTTSTIVEEEEEEEVGEKSSPVPTAGVPIKIKKEVINDTLNFSLFGNGMSVESNGSSTNSQRKDSLGWAAADDFLGMISHTPPAFSPGSLELPKVKKMRSSSISGRLRSASDLEERGFIDRYQKGILKDLIISGDEALQKALAKFEHGDPTALEALLDSGALNRKSSLDLLDELDLGFLNVGSLGDTPKDEFSSKSQTLDEWDELRLDSAFADIGNKEELGSDLNDASFLESTLVNSLPSMGMGITPPNPFSFAEEFIDKKSLKKSSGKQDLKIRKETINSNSISSSASSSRPIGIPGSNLSGSSTTVGGGLSLRHPAASTAANIHNNNSNGIGANSSNVNNLNGKKFVGAYSPDSRRKRIEKFLSKRQKRVWTKKVKYDVRKNFADSRLRVKGRFVKKEDEQLLRELLSFT